MRSAHWFLALSTLLAPGISGAQSTQAPAQQPQSRAALTGLVTDPTGAVVTNTAISLENLATHQRRTASTDERGVYTFNSLPAGRYVVSISLPGFDPYRGPALVVASTNLTANIQLRLADVAQQYTVSADQPTVDPSSNASATTLDTATLDALPDDSDALLQQLQAIAGDTGAKLYVDGFAADRLPPKSSILQVRINSDPYSAENDTSPQYGSIQIITKPGVDNIHGGIFVAGNASALNAPNPFIANQPPYNSDFLYGNLNGPVTKNSSYDGSLFNANNRTNSIVEATTLDSSFNPVQLIQAVPTPSNNLSGNGRFKFQPIPTDIMTLGYGINHNSQTSGSVGQTTLPSQGINTSTYAHIFQLSNTLLFGKNVANVTRLQFVRNLSSQTPVSTAPALIVSGAFTGGGNSGGQSHNTRDHYELQNYVMDTVGKHYLEFGTRLRTDLSTTYSTSNFNGAYTFTSLTAFQITQRGLAANQTPAQILAAGGGASQFTIAAGNPTTSASMTDGAFFVQDDWKARTNLTLSAGLRFETQTGIPDHGKDWAPRLGLSWSLDKKHNWTLRAGSGVFYSRFSVDTILNVRRQNGSNVLTYTTSSPDFYPNIPPLSSLAAQSAPVTYQIASTFRSPYQFNYEGELDRSLGKHGSLAFTAREIRGVHSQYLRNANAPLPGTYNPADITSGTRPFGCCQAIDQYTSGGISRITALIVNANINLGRFGNIFSNYRFRFFNADTSGGFPSNQYSLGTDYGRASNDARHTFYVGYNMPLPRHFRLSFFLQGQTGAPFNIVLSQDLNGDLQFTDRPTFATDLTRPSVYQTRWGNFDSAPIAGQTTIPINYGQGPGAFNNYVSFARSFLFYKEPPKPADPKAAPPKPPTHPYTLDLSIDTENPLNHPNYSTPIGTLGSPYFGKSLSINGDPRSIRFSTNFRF